MTFSIDIHTRSGADNMFYIRLRDKGYSLYKAMLMLIGLKLFGSSHWGGEK